MVNNHEAKELNPAELHHRLGDSFRRLCPDPAGVNRVADARKASPDNERKVSSPLTGMDLPTVVAGTEADMQSACERAKAAQPAWNAMGVRARAQLLGRLGDLIWARRREILDVVQWETGKSRMDAHEELLDQILTLRYVRKVGPAVLVEHSRQGVIPGLTQVREVPTPVGVVGVISPWNYPLALATSDAFAAMVAGNTVVLKPDSLTSLTALMMRSLMNDCGIGADVFQVVCGSGAKLGPVLTAGVNYLMFTGSSATGATIAAGAGRNLIGCSAELGGKNPLIVLPGADVDKVVAGVARACFANAGQLCVSIERIYVHDSLYEAFASRFADYVSGLRVDASTDWEVQMGVLISTAHLGKVKEHVEDAVKKGARVLCGGHPLPEVAPTAFAPTVLADVPAEADLYRDETFGPVVSIYRYRDIPEAIRLANDSEYGLNCSIWGPVGSAQQVARQINCGTVNINDGYAPAWASMDAPMGGMGISGLGRRHGVSGILKYTQAKSIVNQRVLPIMTPSFLTNKQFAEVSGWAMRLLGYIPGVK